MRCIRGKRGAAAYKKVCSPYRKVYIILVYAYIHDIEEKRPNGILRGTRQRSRGQDDAGLLEDTEGTDKIDHAEAAMKVLDTMFLIDFLRGEKGTAKASPR